MSPDAEKLIKTRLEEWTLSSEKENVLLDDAKKPRLHLSAATAAEIGAVDGALVTVSSDRGSLTLPLVVADLPDRVVWVPMRTPDAAVRRDLAVTPGAVVTLTAGGTQ